MARQQPVSTGDSRISDDNATGDRTAGGSVRRELFPDMPHAFARDPGPETDRAIAIMKGFLAEQLNGS